MYILTTNMFLNEYITLLKKNLKLIITAVSLNLVFAIYLIGWHYTSLVINGSYSVLDVSAQFMSLALRYLVISVIVSSFIFTFLLIIRSSLVRKMFIWAVLALFFVSGIIRIFDWGSLYFGGNHINSDFWAHAFYADGLVYLVTKQAFILYASILIFWAAVFFLLRRLSSLTNPEART
jgi:hypothetical protein